MFLVDQTEQRLNTVCCLPAVSQSDCLSDQCGQRNRRIWPNRWGESVYQCTMALSSLPDSVLLTIFDYLPIVDLMSIDVICRRWAGLAPTAFQRRRSLTLVSDIDDLELLRWSSAMTCNLVELLQDEENPKSPLLKTIPKLEAISLHALQIGGELHPAISSLLVNRFPKIVHLKIVQKQVAIGVLEQMAFLLSIYSANLKSLTLHFSHSNQMIAFDDHNDLLDIVNSLFFELNSLPRLRHLSLHLDLPDLGLPFHLPLLAQLETFSVHTTGLSYEADSDILTDSLTTYGTPNSELCSVDIGNPMSLRGLILLSQRITPKFKRVTIEDALQEDEGGLYLTGMGRFCSRFSALHTLTLSLGSLPLTAITVHLAKISTLFHLELTVDSIPPATDSNTDKQIAATTALPSVKLLTLHFSTDLHSDTDRLKLPEIFTHVQVVSWHHLSYRCHDCHYVITSMNSLPKEASQIEECRRLARSPLKDMSTLHSVMIVDRMNRRLVNADEI